MESIKSFLTNLLDKLKGVFDMSKLGFKDVLKVAAVLVGAGVSWAVSHTTTLYGLLVIAITFGVNLYFQRTGKHVGKQALTIICYVFAVVASFVVDPQAWPALPAWCAAASAAASAASACVSDPSAYGQALIAWAGVVLSLGSAVFAFATVVYNTLLEQVLAQLGGSAGA